jgi:hypothetical protein
VIDRIINITSHLSVCIPLITSIVLYKKITRKFYPFLYFIFLVAGYDLLWLLVNSAIPKFKYHTLCFNVYVLIERLFVLQIYKAWGLFEKKPREYVTLVISLISVWTVETFLFSNLKYDNYYFVLVAVLVEALLTIKMINQCISKLDKPLHTDPVFFICTGFTVYFSTSILTVIFLLSSLKSSLLFKWHLVSIADVGVTVMYLIFAYSIILIKKEQPKRLSNKLLPKNFFQKKTSEKVIRVET